MKNALDDQVSLSIGAIRVIVRAFGLSEPEPSTYWVDLAHDISVMRRHRNIDRITLNLIGHDGAIVATHEEIFTTASRPAALDSAQGVELPVIPRDRVAKYSLRVRPFGSHRPYEHLLRRAWTTVPELKRPEGARFTGEHASAKSGGRTRSEIFVSNDARSFGTITEMRGSEFGFALDERLRETVFIHRNFMRAREALRVGQRITYVIVQTPRGLQARDVVASPLETNRREPVLRHR